MPLSRRGLLLLLPAAGRQKKAWPNRSARGCRYITPTALTVRFLLCEIWIWIPPVPAQQTDSV